MKILLHVGMPKCGSSALQTYLSSSSFKESAKARYCYAAVLENGNVLWGDELLKKSSLSPFSYCSSHNGKSLSSLTGAVRANAVAGLKELARKFDTVILSNEGWGPNPDHLTNDCLFAEPSFEVQLIAYVRPQIEWINSAWWQWGAWVDVPFQRWLNRSRPNALWYTLLQQWSAKPWVRKVDVRLMQGDVVQDFMKYLGYEITAQPRSNQSLPDVLLRLFQHHRNLRPGPHDAAIEFVLARNLRMDGGKTPWVIRPLLAERLAEFYMEDNRQLAGMLPDEMRQIMLADQRWWSADVYADRPMAPVEIKAINREALESLAVAAIESIQSMDEELRKLRARVDEGRSA